MWNYPDRMIGSMGKVGSISTIDHCCQFIPPTPDPAKNFKRIKNLIGYEILSESDLLRRHL